MVADSRLLGVADLPSCCLLAGPPAVATAAVGVSVLASAGGAEAALVPDPIVLQRSNSSCGMAIGLYPSLRVTSSGGALQAKLSAAPLLLLLGAACAACCVLLPLLVVLPLSHCSCLSARAAEQGNAREQPPSTDKSKCLQARLQDLEQFLGFIAMRSGQACSHLAPAPRCCDWMGAPGVCHASLQQLDCGNKCA